MSPNEPVDPLHAQCIEAREAIRSHARVLQAYALVWEPAPCPPREVWP
jgi:hypothetical protein